MLLNEVEAPDGTDYPPGLVSAPQDLFLRTADAVHLATASEAGEREVWTNDRQMLAAASYFGLAGRWV